MAVVTAEGGAMAFYVIQLGVGLRLLARWKGWDDGFIVASLSLTYSIISCSVLRLYQRLRRDNMRC